LPVLTWRLAIEEAVSTSERGAAERLVDDVEMTLVQLLEVTAEVQIIDGRVIGREAGSRGDAIVVAAVDSTWWDVYAADSEVLQVLQPRSRMRRRSRVDARLWLAGWLGGRASTCGLVMSAHGRR
jgi:hypothetical protein